MHLPIVQRLPSPLWLELLNVIPRNFRLAQAQALYPNAFAETGDIIIWKSTTGRWGEIAAADFRTLAIAALTIRNRIRNDLLDLVENDGLQLPITINAIVQIELSGGKVELYPNDYQQPTLNQPEMHTYAKDQ